MMDCPEALKIKEPWLAVILSSFLTGVGQMYAGRPARGLLFLLGFLLPILIGIWVIWLPEGSIYIGFILILFGGAIGILNLFDAHRCARKANDIDFENTRKQSKDPWLAVFLSNLIPGIGQFYVRKHIWGVIFIICWIAFAIISKNTLLTTFPLAILSVFACYHAYISSPVHRESSKKLIFIISGIIFIYSFINLHGLIRSRIRPFKIPTIAMAPTVNQGDRILVKMPKKYEPKRGDMIVYISPEAQNQLYLKRAVAFGRETIEIKDGSVYINDKKLDTDPFRNFQYTAAGPFAKKGKPFTVPVGEIFVLGDNSFRSRDSRFIGSIPKSNVIGKAYKRYWPPNRIGPIDSNL